MDVKGITWFGNVYQKFETMCLEVEEAVCQDTVKYVENQVQTVGASVKKFYSEVVDDLISPSLMDPVKVNSLSCTGVHKKPKMGIKEEPKKQRFEDRNANTKVDKNSTYEPSFDRFSNTDPAVPCNPVNSDDLLSSNFAIERKYMGGASKKSNLVIKRKPKNVIPNAFEVPKPANPAATNPSKVAVPSGALTIKNNEAPADQIYEQQLDPDAVSWNFKETGGKRTGDGNRENFKLKQVPDSSVKPANIILSDGTVACHPKKLVVERSFEKEEGSMPMHFTKASDNLNNILTLETSSGPNDTESYGVPSADGVAGNKDAHGFSYSYAEESTEQTGETDGWNIETISSGDDTEEDTDFVDTNFNNHVVLEESCIIVDRDNLPFVSHKEPKHKSYKKKFRDAFSSRGKSMRKKEYMQLAAQYESTTNVGHEQHSASTSLHTSAPDSEMKQLKSVKSCESEWEIL